MIPAVPRPARFVLTLALKALVFVLEVVAILVDGLAGWISPELVATDDGRTLDRSKVSNRVPKA